ncbi:hypothetical protein DM860_010797 [Cuscuta australis]|uniref:Dynamin-type G domain-containing protein n=1 Tax=Cuscuta australis TaxID=267555 RepID=A0A328DZX4_9ASTE|nr:hypothetical protein DM860_010797 [Cuscuta australis]
MHPGPLITRLQHDPVPTPVLTLEYYLDMSVETEEARVVGAINSATESIVGTGKRISRSPLTLVVNKDDVPDLTIIDLPDITRETNEMIMEYISPQETIILNAIPANVDFSTCESIKMSQGVDKTGERKLVVIMKADKSPEGLPQKLTRIQAASIAKQINDKLKSNVAELNKLPNRFSSVLEAMIEFERIMRSAMESLRKILVRGEYEEYPDAKEMHFTARFAEMLNERAFQPEELHAGSLFSKKKAKLISRVKEMVEMERVSDYTCDPEHVTEWNKFMESSGPATRLIWMALGG